MKKQKILVRLLVGLLLIGFTACSSDDGDTNPTGGNGSSTYTISGTITDQDGEAVSGYTVI